MFELPPFLCPDVLKQEGLSSFQAISSNEKMTKVSRDRTVQPPRKLEDLRRVRRTAAKQQQQLTLKYAQEVGKTVLSS